MLRNLVVACAIVAVLPRLLCAESLAETAEKEKARRKAAEQNQKPGSTRVLTNDDLGSSKGQLANDPAAALAATTPARPVARSAAADRPPNLSEESYWHGLAQRRQADVTLWEQKVEQMEAYANALAYGPPRMHDDGITDWQAKRAELLKQLEVARKHLADAKAALAGLEDEARRAGAQPGWLR